MQDNRAKEQEDVSSWQWVKLCVEDTPDTLTKQRALLMKEGIIQPAIDVACNTGGYTIFCDCEVGVDFIKKHLIQLRKDKKIECVCAHVEYLPFRDKSFGTVLLTEIIEHVENPASLLSEAARIGQAIVLSTPLTPVDAAGHVRLYAIKDIVSLFSQFATISSYKLLTEKDMCLILLKGKSNH